MKSSVATISGPDGAVATVTTNYDVLTGLPIVGAGLTAQTASISGMNTVTKLLLKDHLGSMVAEVTLTGSVNAQGQVTAVAIVASSLNVHGFGPWGNARNGLNGDSRGFTGHEHLAELGLIHMNGRIYDPVLGRFLQADPIIQAPHNAQSHNRYSYVMNNPLSFTDPSGFSSWTKFRDRWLKPILSLAVAWAIGPMGFWSMQGGLAGALMGNVAVGVSSASVLSTANFLSSVMAGFAAGGINGGNIQSALRGALTGGILQGLTDAIGSMMAGSGAQSASSGISQGVQEYMVANGNGVVPSGVPGMPSGVPLSDAMPANPQLLERVVTTGSNPIPLCGTDCGASTGRMFAQRMLSGATFALPGLLTMKEVAKPLTQTFYRTMSEANYKQLLATGRVPATSETFVSPSLQYASRYNGVTVELTVQAKTTEALMTIGARNPGLVGGAYEALPFVEKGWGLSGALFKIEQNVINIGLGRGPALDIFNNNLIGFRIAPIP